VNLNIWGQYARRYEMVAARWIIALLLFAVLTAAVVGAPIPREQSIPPDDVAMYNVSSLDANNLNMRLSNMGLFVFGLGGGGLEYPGGSGKTCAYDAGLWIGARVEGETRVTVGWYQTEYSPGPIDENGQWADPADSLHRVYKLVRGDTSSYDYRNWPSDLGAPVNQNGKPLIVGEQTLWCVYNDANPDRHSVTPGGAAPLGVEVQQTAYAFDTPGDLGNTAIVEFKIINKLSSVLNSTYVAIWSDPDIGYALDDLTGCDTTLDLGFAYNGSYFDDVYGTSPPCAGFDLLKGPRSDNGEILGMTSFVKHSYEFDPTGPLESYNLMKGLHHTGEPIVNPITGDTTRFQVSGDPVAGTGWLDTPLTDKRFIMSAGPFTMEPGDTQTLAVGVIVGQAINDRLESISIMKSEALILKVLYDHGFEWPWKPSFEVLAGEDMVTLAWTNPQDPSFQGTMIRYSTVTYPESPTDGEPVPNGDGGFFPGDPGSAGSFVHSGLMGGAHYYYATFASHGDLCPTLEGVAEAVPVGGRAAGLDQVEYEESPGLSVHPNPGRGSISIRYGSRETRGAEAVVYNTVGRIVRTTIEPHAAGSGTEWTWDGRNDGGQELPPGIYFVTVRGDQGETTAKVVLLR
jgi:hypothetical protein